ncbi:STAS domain-containing protein [Massilia arenosa]|uniref:STAS domain-containing protein n=1 Tax=Zemynaea arenosa TaxID=2561931 RepID=A0A4Y9RTE0_9BURK|nr:STAS domain-containing protein [Massilia arenosa]TFW10799.1 STAS domain-containing protein [Massilia arenosa]
MLAVESITFQNARAVLEQGCAAIRGGEREIDLRAVHTADSSAVAVLLAWQRTARKVGGTLSYRNIPAGLHSLAHVYGVDVLLAA